MTSALPAAAGCGKVGAMPTRLLLTLFLFLAPAALAAQEAVTFETGEATVVSADGTRHEFTVELALTGEQMARGLMFREELAPDSGMLFVFPAQRVASFWMRNTLIPLDMLFIARDGRIVRVAERTTPMSDQGVSSRRPVIAVLELAGGTAARLGIAAGDRVESPALP
ncbi:MAG: DUF192 domain-containing protein [Tistlia sp.]|uniref:DUF192 domain-containing protein n=1 Tax=Tistlia sp. TaxID=3057121 RepID=UPI0034A4BF9D